MATCISPETFMNYIENKLSDKERMKIERHLRFCSDCVSTLSLAQNLPSEEELKKIKVPREWVERAKRIGLRKRKS